MARVQRAGADGYTTVISVGGDGTTHWAVNGLMRSLTTPAPALAVIPEGTANDFARCLGIPLKASLAARVLANGVRRRVDVGQMNDRYYATISGVGFDAEVAQRVNQWPRWIRGTTAPHAKIDDGLVAVVYASDLTNSRRSRCCRGCSLADTSNIRKCLTPWRGRCASIARRLSRSTPTARVLVRCPRYFGLSPRRSKSSSRAVRTPCPPPRWPPRDHGMGGRCCSGGSRRSIASMICSPHSSSAWRSSRPLLRGTVSGGPM